jgi:hypothetical protein
MQVTELFEEGRWQCPRSPEPREPIFRGPSFSVEFSNPNVISEGLRHVAENLDIV